MADILAEFFNQFGPVEKAEIKAAEEAAQIRLIQGKRGVNDRRKAGLGDREFILEPQDKARADAACYEFVAYHNVLWRKTNPVSPESVRQFLAHLDRICEGVLAKYGAWEGKGQITELSADARQKVWLIHAEKLAKAKAAPAPAQVATRASAETRRRRNSILRKYRTDNGLTVADFARRARMSPTAIRGMVNGDRSRYGEERLTALLKVIAVPPDQW